MIDRFWIREFVERQSCRTTRVHFLSVQIVQKRPNRNIVNRFRARIAGLSIILHPFGIFLRNSILKFLGAYGFFYFRLLESMYEAVWMLHIAFLVVLRVVTTFLDLVVPYFITSQTIRQWKRLSLRGFTYIFIRVLQLITKACRQHV